MITCLSCGKPATMGSLCLSCFVERRGPAVVKGWDWMSDDEQIAHLIDSHGYDEDWFDQDDGPWDRPRVEQYFADGDVRFDYHSGDHHEHPHGGGSESKQHEHSLTHPGEVAAAIASIKEAIHARR